MAYSPTLVQKYKFVNLLIGATTSVGPGNIDTDAVRAFDYVSMKDYGHLTLVVQLGVTGGASNVTLLQASDVAATGEKALAFSTAYRNLTATGAADALSSFAVTSDTFATSTNDGVMYVIEIDAEDLDVDNGFDCVTIAMSDPAAATNVNILAILSDSRYPGATPPTAITD